MKVYAVCNIYDDVVSQPDAVFDDTHKAMEHCRTIARELVYIKQDDCFFDVDFENKTIDAYVQDDSRRNVFACIIEYDVK